jgi:hypothetical protein
MMILSAAGAEYMRGSYARFVLEDVHFQESCNGIIRDSIRVNDKVPKLKQIELKVEINLDIRHL